MHRYGNIWIDWHSSRPEQGADELERHALDAAYAVFTARDILASDAYAEWERQWFGGLGGYDNVIVVWRGVDTLPDRPVYQRHGQRAVDVVEITYPEGRIEYGARVDLSDLPLQERDRGRVASSYLHGALSAIRAQGLIGRPGDQDYSCLTGTALAWVEAEAAANRVVREMWPGGNPNWEGQLFSLRWN